MCLTSKLDSPTVVLLVRDLGGGAFTELAVALADGLENLGISTEIVAMNVSPIEKQRFNHMKIYSIRALRGSTSIFGLIRYLRASKPQFLVSFSTLMNFYAIVAAKLGGFSGTTVISEHSNLTHNYLQIYRHQTKMKYVPRLMKLLYPHAQGLFVPTLAIAEDPMFRKILSHSRIPTKVIPNPVAGLGGRLETVPDHPWFTPDQDPKPIVAVAIGRLEIEKDFATLIRAVSLVRLENPKFKLIILGEGSLRHSLETLIDDLGLADAVSLPGFVSNARDYLRFASLFISTSLWEGFGLAIVEAMSEGCPVVCSEAPGGPTTFLQHRRNSVVVPIGEPEEIAKAAIEVLEDPILRNRIVVAAREDAKRFDPTVVATQLAEFLQELEESTCSPFATLS